MHIVYLKTKTIFKKFVRNFVIFIISIDDDCIKIIIIDKILKTNRTDSLDCS